MAVSHPSPAVTATGGERVLESDADIRDGVRALREACPVIRRVHDLTGDPPLRRHESGFAGLCRVIVGQQLSMASADAIWRRTAAVAVPFEAPVLLALPDAALRGAGLSHGKIRTLRAVAAAVADGLDLARLALAPEPGVHAALRPIPGIGPWTVDIFLMFCAGRADAWAAGDLGLRAAVERAFRLPSRPDGAETLKIASRWRPWRGVAARMLWAYYAKTKQAETGR